MSEGLSIPSEAEVPLSSRLSVSFLLASSFAWFLAGLALLLAASVSLHSAAWWPTCAALSYGRLHAAALDALAYGFAGQAGLGLALWAAARSVGALPAAGLTFLAALFWNLGISVGVGGILVGEGGSLPWLEFPGEAWWPLLAALGWISAWGVVSVVLACRRDGRATSSSVCGLAGLVAGVWVIGTAAVLASNPLIRGVSLSIMGGWVSQTWLLLSLGPLALAALYRDLGESDARPGVRPAYGPLGFWSWIFLCGWTGGFGLVGGPAPAWVSTVSVASTVLLIIPTALIGIDLFGRGSPSAEGKWGYWSRFAAGSFVLAGVARSATGLRCAQRILKFTQFAVGMDELWLVGFIAFALLGGIAAALPSLIGRSLPDRRLTFAHFAGSALGLVLMVLAYGIGGWRQGFALDNPAVPVASITQSLLPWLYLHSLGVTVLLAGQLALAGNLAAAAWGAIRPFRGPVLRFILTEINPDWAVKAP